MPQMNTTKNFAKYACSAAEAVEKLFTTLRQLAAEGVSILYISHKLAEVRAETRQNHDMTLTFALSYGGRREIVAESFGAAPVIAASRVRSRGCETSSEKSCTPAGSFWMSLSKARNA